MRISNGSITRPGSSIEFGAASVEAESTVAYSALHTEKCPYTPAAATTVKVSNALGVVGGTTDLDATLSRTCDSSPVSNATIDFMLNGISVGPAATNESGLAVLRHVSLGGLGAGSYANGIDVSFAGDANSQPANGAGTLTVLASGTVVGRDAAALVAAIANASGGGTLELSPGFTYILTQPATPNGADGLSPISSNLTIHGNGATILRDQIHAPLFRIFEVADTGSLIVDHLTISSGYANNGDGGGILIRGGAATISQSTIIHNIASSGGGIKVETGGELRVSQSTIAGNTATVGAGISNLGTVTISQSTIVGNAASSVSGSSGGGIANAGLLNIELSTITGNYGAFDGGAIYNLGAGESTITQSTIAKNSAGREVNGTGSGIFDRQGSFDNGTVTLIQTILAENVTDRISNASDNCVGSVLDGGYNLEDSNSNQCGFSQATSISTTRFNIKLGRLHDYGGPTMTHALKPGSLAIDAGPAICLLSGQASAFDQRGVARPQGSRCDIGAYEFEVELDSRAPTINCTVPYQSLWYGSDVGTACTASDSESGLANPSDAAFTLSTSVAPGTDASNASTDSRQVCDQANNCATAGPYVFRVDKQRRAVTITVPADAATYTLGQVVAAVYNCDDGTGSGIGACAGPVVNGASLDTATIGSHSFAVTATDNAGNTATAANNCNVGYNFNGFFQPVDNLPTLNIASAGSAIPVKFSLGGYQGLSIFAAGHPASSSIQCDASEVGAVVDETVNAGSSSLTYNASNDQYSYIWKTDKSWKGTCRVLVLKLTDGSQHLAKFRFR